MIGDILQQRYQIVDFLGKGGQGHTYLAIDKHRPGHPRCVVKHLKPFFNEPRFLETAKRLFQTEAEILAKLSNYDQIPQLFAYFEQDSEFYLVEEFIDGQDLSKEMGSGKQLGETYVMGLLKGILPVLEVLHQKGVIHRDIKPPNIIRRKSDKQLVLIDFGAVKQFQHDLTHAANLSIDIGSPGYTPSEQLRGRPKPSSDIYALGMMCIQALTGIHPRHLEEDESDEVRWQHLTSVSPILADTLSKMVRHNTKERYKSATDVLIALERLNYQSSTTITGNNSRSSVGAAHMSAVQRPETAAASATQLNANSDSTIISPPSISSSSRSSVGSATQSNAQTYDPWASPSQTANAHAKQNVPPSNTVTNAKTAAPSQVNEKRENRTVPQSNSASNASGFVSHQNSISPIGQNFVPQPVEAKKNAPASPSITPSRDNTFVPSQHSARSNERTVTPQNYNSRTNTFVDRDLTEAIEPSFSPATSHVKINPNIAEQNSNGIIGNRPKYALQPRRSDRFSGRGNNNKKLYPIAIGGGVIIATVAGFFSIVAPMLSDKDNNSALIASNSKPTAKSATTESTTSKPTKANQPKLATKDTSLTKSSSSNRAIEPKQTSAIDKTKTTNIPKPPPPKTDTNAVKPSANTTLAPIIAPEKTEAKQILAKANKLANGGNYKDAISEADKVSIVAIDEYSNAQEKIALWSVNLIERAKQKYEGEGKLDEAIAMLQVIPPNVSQVETAKGLIDRWNQEWTQNQKSLEDAQRAIVDSRWQEAIEAADVIVPTNKYWKSKKTKLQNEILAKRASSKEQQAQPPQAQPPNQSQTEAQGQLQNNTPTASNSSSNNTNGCLSGYVWRQVTPEDRVCVSPQTRQQVAFDNSQVEERRNASAYDPESCIDDYVWREATPGDRVCVTPEIRQQTSQDNAQAEARKAK
ncbi:MAG: protein kinase domain-containing protein [Xenococcaceae cyanobacterium]